MKLTIASLIEIPYEVVLDSIRKYIENIVADSGVDKIVVGLSGGLDSSTLLKILADTLSTSSVKALILPDSRVTPPEDVKDAVELAREIGVEYHVVYIDDIVNSYRILPFYKEDAYLPTGNLRARVRMNILYYYANMYGALVAGSSDRSEILIGYFTKHGDGAADLYPLSCLYKTQVRELAKRLGLPSKIVNKPSAPRLWPEHIAERELGYKYEEIDLALYALFDLSLDVEKATGATGLPRRLFERILELHRRSRHKRSTGPYPTLPWVENPIREI